MRHTGEKKEDEISSILSGVKSLEINGSRFLDLVARKLR